MVEVSAAGCKTCANLEENVRDLLANASTNDGDAVEVQGANAVQTGDTFLVFVDFDQNSYRSVTKAGEVKNEYEGVPGAQFKFTLTTGDPWSIQEIEVAG